MGKTKGAPRNSSTVVFQHKFPFPEGRGLVGKVFCFPESTQGLEIHEEQGWDAKWQCLLWAHGKSWKNNWKSRKGAVLGHQDSRMGGVQEEFLLLLFHNQLLFPPGCGNRPGQGRQEKFSFPHSPKKTKPLLHDPRGAEIFVVYNFPRIPSSHLGKYSLTPPQVRDNPGVFPYLTGPLIPAPSF